MLTEAPKFDAKALAPDGGARGSHHSSGRSSAGPTLTHAGPRWRMPVRRVHHTSTYVARIGSSGACWRAILMRIIRSRSMAPAIGHGPAWRGHATGPARHAGVWCVPGLPCGNSLVCGDELAGRDSPAFCNDEGSHDGRW